MLLFLQVIFAQEAIISGKVTDEKGAALIGASIIYKGDFTRGATADLYGNYQLSLPAGKVTIICRFTNMISDTLVFNLKQGETRNHDFVLLEFQSEFTTLEGVDIRVGKFDKRPEDITVSLEIIKPELIENKNTRSVETILDQTPGLNILDGEPQIRGGSGFTFGVGSKVAVLVDDMPLLSGDAGRPEWSFIPVENIKQIEVVKGAGSVLAGSSALSGMIHIRTKYPTNTPLTKVNVYGGVYSSPGDDQQWWDGVPVIVGANFLHSRKAGNWDLVFGGNINYDHGYIGPPVLDSFIAQTYPDTISNFSNNQMAAKQGRFNFNAKHRSKKYRGLSYGLNGNGMLRESVLSFAWLNDTSGLYQGYPGAVFLQQQTIFNLDPFVNLNLESGSKHKLRGRFLYTDNEITANQSNQSSVGYLDYQFYRSYEMFEGFEFIGGLSSQFTDSYAELYAGSGTPDNQLLNVSGYGQIEKKVQEVLNLSVGGRLEYYALNDTITDIQPIFRAGASLKVHQETYLRVSYGQGYRFPSITERFIQTGIGNFGVFPNPDLVPEISSNSEVGVKQGLKFGKLYGYLDIAAFWQEYENTVEYLFGFWDLTSPLGAGFKFLNTGRSRILGIDVSFSGQAKLNEKNTLNFIAGYNYIVPKTLNPDFIYAVDEHPVNPREYSYNTTSLDNSRNILKYRFLHNVKCDVEWEHNKTIAIGFSAKYFSKIENLDAVIEEFEESTAVVNTIQNIRYMEYFIANQHGNWIFDARVSYSLSSKHKFALIVSNLTNNKYSLRPLRMEPLRQIMFQYTLKL
jgi:outer membrane receptor protein involved in Fe transport